jgi:hypothetical protein
MDDTTFEFEPRDVTEGSRRFPAHRRTTSSGHPAVDLSYLATAPGVEFGRHAWDEGGHY